MLGLLSLMRYSDDAENVFRERRKRNPITGLRLPSPTFREVQYVSTTSESVGLSVFDVACVTTATMGVLIRQIDVARGFSTPSYLSYGYIRYLTLGYGSVTARMV